LNFYKQNGAGGIPAFGLEPKSAKQISIRALPLWPAFGGHPDDVEKFFFHTFLGFESLPPKELT
jgi:hypothetical protein